MNIINYFSISAIPVVIFIIIVYGLIEKNKVYETFLDGVKEGIEIVIKIFPTLLAIFFAVGLLRASGVLHFFVQLIYPLLEKINIPSEIVPLALIRPISGSASLAIATDIMKQYGVDTTLGLIASTVMGSTETTFYVIAIYTSSVGIKKIRFVLIAALIADFVGILSSVVIWRFLS